MKLKKGQIELPRNMLTLVVFNKMTIKHLSYDIMINYSIYS